MIVREKQRGRHIETEKQGGYEREREREREREIERERWKEVEVREIDAVVR